LSTEDDIQPKIARFGCIRYKVKERGLLVNNNNNNNDDDNTNKLCEWRHDMPPPLPPVWAP